MDRCFVAPLKNEDKTKINNLEVRKGIIVYDNNTLNSLNIYKGDLVSYKKSREFEFVVDGKLLYCMKSNDILIHHEYEGNEKEYNPSWAISS